MYQISTDIGWEATVNHSLLAACQKAVSMCHNAFVGRSCVVDKATGEVIAEYRKVYGALRKNGTARVWTVEKVWG